MEGEKVWREEDREGEESEGMERNRGERGEVSLPPSLNNGEM